MSLLSHPGRRFRRRLTGLLVVLLTALLTLTGCGARTGAAPDPAMPPIRHVFVIMLENARYDQVYGRHPEYPYLADTLRPKGVLLTQFYAIAHWSLSNYLAMISGQAPTRATQADCPRYTLMKHATRAAQGQVRSTQGCVYPSWVPSLPGQLVNHHLTWKAYMQDMGKQPGREQATCGAPALGPYDADRTQKATSQDAYAARHNPFIYFAAIRDNPSCHRLDGPLNRLRTDLKKASTTANFSYISPSLCDDGHNQCAAPNNPDHWLATWIPRITASPAYRHGGMIIILADESVNDSSACCQEPSGPNLPYPGWPTKATRSYPGGGKGGGRIGALVLSPFVRPGSRSKVPYNDFSLLRTFEDIFGLSHLGYAAQPGLRPFGPDVWAHTASSTT